MKKYQLLTVLIMTLGVLLFNVQPALAALVPPSEFWGTVTIDGVTNESATIIGKINAQQYGNAAKWSNELGYWTYVLSIPPDDPTTTGIKEGGVDGDIVDIYINGLKATETGTWHSGPVRLDLTAFTTTVLVGDGSSPADKIVKGSDTNKAVSTFTLATNQNTDTVTALTVTGTGTSNVASSGVKLWRDSGSTANEWDSGDTQVGSGVSFTGSTATFSSLNIAVSTTSVKYLITYNIAASPTNGQTMQAAVTGVTATNNVTNNDNNDATLTVDSVVPTVTFKLQTASDSGSSNTDNITNVASPVIDATFSEAITGFAAGDLSNTGTATGCVFAIGTASGNVYPVTVSSCSAGTLIVRMAASGVSDTAGNAIAQTDGPTITLDRSVTVTFDLQTASDSGASSTDNITNVTSPVIDAIFGEAVTGFAAGDLTNTGTATGCSFAVGTASGNTYPVTVSSCTAGTLIVRMAASGVTDTAGNNIAQTDGPTITIDRTVPTVTFDLQTASDTGTSSTDNLTSAASPVIDAIFSEAISGFANTDLSNTGTATGCSFTVGTASGNTYPVTVSSCTAGTLIVRMTASGVTDTAGNNIAQTDGPTITIERTVPTVTFDLQTASDSGTSSTDNITNVASPVIDAIFSEAISGFAAADLSNTGTATGCSFAVGTASGNTYPVTVSSCTAGTLIVRMAASGVSDTAGNAIAQTAGPTITLDRSVTVTFDLQTASDSGASSTDNITNVTSPVIDAIFGEAVTGFANADLSNTGTATGCSFSIGTATNNTYPVTVSSCTAGTLIVRMAASGVTDTAGNNIAQTDGPTITIDRTVPTVTFDLQTASDTGTSSTDNLTSAASPVIDAIFSEAISGFANTDLSNTGTATGCSFTVGTASGNTYPVTVSSCTAGTLIVRMTASGVTDTAGNNIAQTDGPTVTIDRTAPTISIGAPSVTTTATGPVTYTVTYADTNFNSNTLATGNITLNITGTADATVAVTGTGLTPTITLSSITGNGTLGISIAAGTASDLAGNTASAAGPSTTFTVNNVTSTTTVGDGTSPANKVVKGSDANKAVSAFTLATSQGTDTVTALTVTGSGTGLANVAASGVKLWQDNGTNANEWDATDTAVGNAVSFSGTTASFSGLSVPVTTTATQYLVTYTIIASPVNAQTMLGAVTSVTATNSVLNNDNTDATLTVDSVVPTVTFDLQTASDTGTSSTDNLTNAANPLIDAIFSEAISDFTASDLSNTGTATGCSFAVGTASGNTYPVTVSSCSEGTLILRMAASGVTDAAGNAIAQTDGPTISIDRTAPTISIGVPSLTTTTTGPVTFTITYADTNYNSSTLTTGNVTLNKTGTANGIVAITGTGLTRTVTISNITGNGTLNISIAAGTASDLAGNLAPAAGPSISFTVGNVTFKSIFLPLMFR